jgi:non-canonical purine NTP pyrophosphatase (RdgB/HAM1 family)
VREASDPIVPALTFYLASGNAHKVAELEALVRASALDLTILSARAVGGLTPVVEDAGTFVGNARKKARALRAKLPAGAWALADDSGLCVDALDGHPGVESAYYAGPEGDAAANLRKLTAVMRDVAADRRGLLLTGLSAAVGIAAHNLPEGLVVYNHTIGGIGALAQRQRQGVDQD